jgi:acyl carrier protein
VGQRLVACVVPRDGEAPPAAELRDFLRRTLPEFMVPSAFSFLAALPLSPNGKVDRKALAAASSRASTAVPVAADRTPRSPLEARLAAIWSEALEIPGIGIHDNFFDLGGHSLMASRVASRLARDLGIELPVSALFQAPTVAQLAGRLASAGVPAAAVEEPAPLISPAPQAPRRERSVPEVYVAPRNALERRLVELWAEVLDYDRVGAQDDFFDLGGHSLLGTRLILEIQGRFGVDLQLAELFDARTPAGLARRLEALGVDSGPSRPAMVTTIAGRSLREKSPLPQQPLKQSRSWTIRQASEHVQLLCEC